MVSFHTYLAVENEYDKVVSLLVNVSSLNVKAMEPEALWLYIFCSVSSV